MNVEGRQRHLAPLVIQHQRGFQIDAIEPEPARIAPDQPPRPPLPGRGFPVDLGKADSLAQTVEDVEQLGPQIVAVDPVAHHIGNRHVPGVIAGGLDRHVQLRHRPLSGRDHAQVMRVAFLDHLGQFEILHHVAMVGRPQKTGQDDRVQPVTRIARDGRAHPADGGRGHIAGQVGALHRVAPMVQQLRLAAHQIPPLTRIPRGLDHQPRPGVSNMSGPLAPISPDRAGAA